MTRIERIKTDQISENPPNPRHPRAIKIILMHHLSILHVHLHNSILCTAML